MSDFDRTVKMFKDAINRKGKQTAPLDIMGKVTRVEDGVAWVRFAGSEVGDTPVRMNIDCKEGDDVQVRSSGGKAWIVGNQTAPPTDDSKAEAVEKKTTEIVTRVEKAEKVAGSAADVANAVNQKVWSDEAGLHIADGKQDAAAERNTIWNALGMLFRKGLNPILGVLTGGNPRVAIYDGQGSGEEHEVASFGEKARIGKKGSPHVYVEGRRIAAEDGDTDDMYGTKYFEVGSTEDSEESMQIMDVWPIEGHSIGRTFRLSYYPIGSLIASVNNQSAPVTQTDDRRYAYIPNELFEGDEVRIWYRTYGANSYFTFGNRNPLGGVGKTSFSSGVNNVASGIGSFATGGYSEATANYAHVEGSVSVASGLGSHAEGRITLASGDSSHSEGMETNSTNTASHSEGRGTTASGYTAHAEGSDTKASGMCSHAEGSHTIANSDYQHVEGKYNIEDANSKYAHIIGNGPSEGNRSNALTVDWNGTIRTDKNSMKTLWSGAWWMNEGQTATLEEKVSEQLTGIVLVWSYYTGGAAQNYGWHTTFIPKAMVQLHNGVGWDIELRRTKNATFGTKYVYVNDDRIVGHADNIATGTANNVPYKNNQWVLRYVFGC